MLESIFKVAETDEEQEVEGAQLWTVPEALDRASTGAT